MPEQLEVIIVPVDKLDPNPWNPNRMDERTYEAERESIRAYGFVDPVTARPHPKRKGRWQVIDGEHRLRAAVEEGHKTVPVIVLDIDEARAKKLTVILNETRGDADVALLGKLLAELSETMAEPDFLAGLNYSDAEIAHLVDIGKVDWDDFQAAADNATNGDEHGDLTHDTHEVVLNFDAKGYDRFRRFEKMIAKEGSHETVEATVLAAVEAAAKAL